MINGKRLRELRQTRGFTMGELEIRSSVTKANICRLERGMRTNPTINTLIRLAQALNCDMNELIATVR